MKRHAFLLGSFVTLAATVALSEEPVPGRRLLPLPAPILPTVPPPAATQAISPAPAPPPRRGFTLADLKAQVSQNKDGSFLMEVPAILNTSTDREVQALLTGQPVQTTGQVMPESVGNAEGKSLRITRSQLQCCAEHARPCSIALKFSGTVPAFEDLAWVTLVGSISYEQEGGKTVPVIIVKEIKKTTAPRNQLLQ